MANTIRASLQAMLLLAFASGTGPLFAADDDAAQNGEETGTAEGGAEDTIVSVLEARGDFGQTTEALEQAGLAETLEGQGPFTVFAPTDAAWEQLAEDERDHLMSEEGLSDLRTILSYHVVPDEIRAEDVQQMGSLTTIQGQPLEVSRDGDQISVNGVSVSDPGLDAGNGIVHGIDEVLMPRQ